MNNKKDIVDNWLPRYTGTALGDFGQYILLTNFHHYVKLFAEWNNVPINGLDKPMPNATSNGITIINFGIGSPNAALIMDLLSAIQPKAALFLGKCGGLKKKNAVGVNVGGVLHRQSVLAAHVRTSWGTKPVCLKFVFLVAIECHADALL